MILYVLMFITGACIGSFINVIFSRRDWFHGRSRCDSCGYTLKWYDMIPLLSYIFLLGKCRKCKKKIDSSHFMSELFMGAAFLCGSLSFARYGIFYGIMVSAALFPLAVAAIEDYKEQMVYSFILNGGIILTLTAKIVMIKAGIVSYDILLMVLSVLALKLMGHIASFAFKGKIGAGDFDAFAIMYILGGVEGLMMSLTVGSIIGCIVYIPQILMKKRDKNEPLPFIPLLYFGTLATVMLGGLA